MMRNMSLREAEPLPKVAQLSTSDMERHKKSVPVLPLCRYGTEIQRGEVTGPRPQNE